MLDFIASEELSALDKYKAKLKQALTLGRPLIHIETSDYEWERKVVEHQLEEVKKGIGKFSWSPFFGYRNESTEKSIEIVGDSVSKMFLETLDNFVSLEETAILFLQDIAYYFDPEYVDREFLSQLYSRLYFFYCKEEKEKPSKRAVIIILSPKFNIPIELQGYLYRLTPPFPDEDDIAYEMGLKGMHWEEIQEQVRYRHVIERQSPSNHSIIYRYRQSFFQEKRGICTNAGFEDNKKKLLSAFKGMRIRSIQILLSYSETPYEIRGGDKMAFLLESKKRMVRDSELLKLEDVPEGYNNFVGDIDGLKDYVEKVKTIIDNRANYNSYMAMPKGILLVGPPGCGKSETSKAVADILNVPLLSMDMGRLMSKWAGELEHNFENAIALAEAAQPCVLRIDELEKAFSGTGDGNNDDHSGVRILGYFLTWMQERSSTTYSKSLVYLVATANNLEQLRPEFLRKGRWDEIFYLIYPSEEGMKKIIRSCLDKYHLTMSKIGSDENEDLLITEIVSEVFQVNPKCKISGAEIFDAIERAYKDFFCSNQSKGVKTKNTIDYLKVKENLIQFANQKRNIDLERKVRDELRGYQIDHQRNYHPLTKKQEEQIKETLKKKYSKSNVETLIQQEIASLRISHLMSNATTEFYEKEVSNAVRDKYSDQYVNKLLNDDFIEITMGYRLNNEPDIDPMTTSMLEAKLREKYEDVQDYEEYYESKGYRSASKKQ